MKVLVSLGLGIATVVALEVSSGGAAALGKASDRLREPACGVAPRPGWTAAECWAWRRLCVGAPADFSIRSGAGGTLDPSRPNGWTERRQLSPHFLRTIVLYRPYREALPPQGVLIRGAYFVEDVDLSDSVLERRFAIEDSRFEGNLKLRRLRTNHYLSVERSYIQGAVDLSFSTVEQVALGGAEFQEFTMAAATVRNQLVLMRAKARDRVNLFSIHVEQGLFLNEASIPGLLNLERARLKGDLYVRGAELQRANLTDAVVEGTLFLDRNELHGQTTAMRWLDGGSLSLRDARVGSITTGTEPGIWPRRVELNGLRYTRFSLPPEARGSQAASSPEFLNEPVEWFLDLLRRGESSPQPYRQLAEVFEANGYPEKAKRVLFEGKNEEWRKARCDAVGGCVRLGFLTLSWAFIGYGYRLYYAGWWCLGFLIAGALIFRRSHEARVAGMPYGVAYSFDSLIPLVKLREKHKEIDLRGWQRYYFYAHRIMGYILATFLVAGLSGLAK